MRMRLFAAKDKTRGLLSKVLFINDVKYGLVVNETDTYVVSGGKIKLGRFSDYEQRYDITSVDVMPLVGTQAGFATGYLAGRVGHSAGGSIINLMLGLGISMVDINSSMEALAFE